jgi:predicted dehydrogenase
MGGGALMDVGVYELHAWVALCGSKSEFELISVERTLGASGVDLTTKSTGTLAGSRVESLSSFEQPEFQKLEVIGTLGAVNMLGDAPFTAWNATCQLSVNDQEESFEAVDAYQIMVEQISEKILGGPTWVVPLADSLRVAQILEQLATAER